MVNDDKSYAKFSYDAHARTCDPNDFLGQTKRTVGGVPVSEDQIHMIVHAIKHHLSLEPKDDLLEFACGNGSVSHHLFDHCKTYQGVDISEYLVSVAKKNFERAPHHVFDVSPAQAFLDQQKDPMRFNKAVCYAAFQYFPDADAKHMLVSLREQMPRVKTIFLGNMPDKEKQDAFYKNRQPSEQELNDPETAVGIWRKKSDIERIATQAGWKVIFCSMPEAFNGAYYRFDALLYR